MSANHNHFIIAIDGPSGSGKSTTAKLVADALDLLYLDTGAMYRGITLAASDAKYKPESSTKFETFLQTLKIEFTKEGLFVLNGTVRESEIRSPEIAAQVSQYSALPEVRKYLTQLQRTIAETRSCVLDGRDIGTVVFPNAQFKFFLVADIDVRAKRRFLELQQKGVQTTLESVKKNLEERDYQDSNRAVSPLKKADDAIEINTTNQTIQQQAEEIIQTVSVVRNERNPSAATRKEA